MSREIHCMIQPHQHTNGIVSYKLIGKPIISSRSMPGRTQYGTYIKSGSYINKRSELGSELIGVDENGVELKNGDIICLLRISTNHFQFEYPFQTNVVSPIRINSPSTPIRMQYSNLHRTGSGSSSDSSVVFLHHHVPPPIITTPVKPSVVVVPSSVPRPCTPAPIPAPIPVTPIRVTCSIPSIHPATTPSSVCESPQPINSSAGLDQVRMDHNVTIVREQIGVLQSHNLNDSIAPVEPSIRSPVVRVSIPPPGPPMSSFFSPPSTPVARRRTDSVNSGEWKSVLSSGSSNTSISSNEYVSSNSSITSTASTESSTSSSTKSIISYAEKNRLVNDNTTKAERSKMNAITESHLIFLTNNKLLDTNDGSSTIGTKKKTKVLPLDSNNDDNKSTISSGRNSIIGKTKNELLKSNLPTLRTVSLSSLSPPVPTEFAVPASPLISRSNSIISHSSSMKSNDTSTKYPTYVSLYDIVKCYLKMNKCCNESLVVFKNVVEFYQMRIDIREKIYLLVNSTRGGNETKSKVLTQHLLDKINEYDWSQQTLNSRPKYICMCNQLTCIHCYGLIVGNASKATIDRYRVQCKGGTTMAIHGNAANEKKQRGVKSTICSALLTEHLSRGHDSLPDKHVLQLNERGLKELHTNLIRGIPNKAFEFSLSTLYRTIEQFKKEHSIKINVNQAKCFITCTICQMLDNKEKDINSKKPIDQVTLKQVQEQRAAHLTEQRLEREVFYAAVARALESPNYEWVFMQDGMGNNQKKNKN